MYYHDIYEELRKTIFLQWRNKLNEFAEKKSMDISDYFQLISFSKKMTEMIEVTLANEPNPSELKEYNSVSEIDLIRSRLIDDDKSKDSNPSVSDMF